MKVQKRGKYAGIKVHLTPEECIAFTDYPHLSILERFRTLLRQAIEDDPTLLQPRTEDEVHEALLREQEKATARLDDLPAYLVTQKGKA
jgi:hypothetical protein